MSYPGLREETGLFLIPGEMFPRDITGKLPRPIVIGVACLFVRADKSDITGKLPRSVVIGVISGKAYFLYFRTAPHQFCKCRMSSFSGAFL